MVRALDRNVAAILENENVAYKREEWMTSRGRIRAFVEWKMGGERAHSREIEFNVCFSDLQKHFPNIRYAKLARDTSTEPYHHLIFIVPIW